MRAALQPVANSALFLFATALQAVATLLVVPFLTRILGEEEFGLASTGLIASQLVWIVASLGLPAVITRTYFTDRDGEPAARRLLGAALLFAAPLVAGFLLTMSLWGPVLGYPVPTLGLMFAVLGGGALAATNAAMALLRAQERAGRFFVVVVLATAVAQIGGLAACMLDSGATHATYLGAVLLVLIGAATTGVALTRPSLPRRPDVGPALRLALPAVPHMLGIVGLAAADRVAVSFTLGPEAVGQYQVAYLVGTLTLSIVLAVNNAWVAVALKHPESLVVSTRAVAIGAVGVSASIVLAAPLLLAVAAPPDFRSESLNAVVVALSLTALPFVHYLASMHVLVGRGDTRVLLFAAPLAALVSGLAGVVLVSSLGLVGAAIGVVMGYLLVSMTVSLAAGRLTPTLPRLRATLVLVPVVAGAAALGLVVPVDALIARLALATAFLLTTGFLLARMWAALGARPGVQLR
jgi:O-antigen/teichoic acid export membrane protein